MAKKPVHLVCNAHLDPVWLWNWEDGLAEAIATFRVAADFCETHPAFVFNHNEALLYHWIEQHEPDLFRRIQALVAAGRWHIAGGAYLQPDVNNPHGESHIRQFLLGLAYFRDKFAVRPTTAYNFDPFGHPEGFAQILAGCGMDSYVFCRPDYGTHDLPVGAFLWRDRSGAEVLTRRSDDHYLTNGRIVEQLARWLPHYADEPATMILWGIGNHGGGVSRAEYSALTAYTRKHPEYEWLQSTPEAFFRDLRRAGKAWPTVRGEIQNSFAGCYTSMSRVKRAHRAAEGLMQTTERLAALAWWYGCSDYPAKDLEVAWKDILFAEFHDVLPGSCVPAVEKDSLAMLGHATEILRRVRVKTLLRVLRDERAGAEGEVPIFIVNPHGFRVRTQVEFEYHLASFIEHDGATITLRHDGKPLVFQPIKPDHNLGSVGRSRIALPVDLAPWEIYRVDASFTPDLAKRKRRLPAVSQRALRLQAGRTTVQINPGTGLIDGLYIGKERRSLVGPGAFRPVLFNDLDHSWTCGDPEQMSEPKCWSTAPAWKRPAAAFRLATAREAAELSPLASDKWTPAKTTAARPLRIVEHGPVRTVVEAMFVHDNSAIIRHYVIGGADGPIEIRDRVLCNEKDKMLKLAVPLGFTPVGSRSEAPYSAVEREPTAAHSDRTNQRWVAVHGRGGPHLAIVNDGSFAHSLTPTGLFLNILRTPAYSSFNLAPGNAATDCRFAPRHDQGEHEVRFQVLATKRFSERRLAEAAATLNAAPYAQVYFPGRGGRRTAAARRPDRFVTVDRDNVHVVAVKKSEKGSALIVRLQELGGMSTAVQVSIHGSRRPLAATVSAYGLTTLKISRRKGGLNVREVNLVEGL